MKKIKYALLGVLLAGLFLQPAPPALGGELVNLRTETSRTIDNGNGSFTWQGSQGPIHYKNAQGNWTPIDNGITTNGSMTSDAINFRILQNLFSFGQIIQYSVNGSTVTLQPMALDYINNLNQIQPIANPAAVTGVYSNSTAPLFSNPNNHIGKVTYANAYGTGINMSWGLDAGRITKLLSISSMSNLPTPSNTTLSGGSPSIRLSFIFAHSNNISVYGDNTLWNEGTQAVQFSNIDFRNSGNQTLFRFLPVTYYDSSNRSVIHAANATLRRSGQSLYIEARVPLSWLMTATFPVFIDPSASAQVGASNQDIGVSRQYAGDPTIPPSEDWGIDGNIATNEIAWGFISNSYTDASGFAEDININYRKGAGMYFPSVGVPTSSTITEAHMIITPKTASSGTTVNTRIIGNKIGNAAVWSTLANYQARRGTAVGGATNDNRTAANVSWDGIAADVVDTAKNTPDIASVVQEIVNLPAWAQNNNMAFWIDDHENRSSASRGSWSWDGSTSKCPQLSITYTTGGGGSPAPTEEPLQIIWISGLIPMDNRIGLI